MTAAPPGAGLGLLRLYCFLAFPFACIPFLYFFYKDNGVDPQGYTLLIAVYYLTMSAAEIPTGVLADRLGWRGAMALGPAIFSSGFLVTWLSSSLAGFAAGQALMGLGHAVMSGPPTAFLFDMLARAGEEGRFLALESGMHGARLAGTSLSFLAGGFVAHHAGLPATVLLTAALCLAAAATALFLPRPGPGRESPPRGPPLAALPPTVASILGAAARALASPAVRWIILYYALLFFLLRFGFHTYQVYMDEAELRDYRAIGLLYFLLNVAAVPCARLAPAMVRTMGLARVLALMPSAIILSLLVMALRVHPAMVLLFFTHQLPFGAHWSVVQNMVNRLIESRARATVLSAMSFAGRILTTAMLPAAGFVLQRGGVAAGFAATGAACAAALLLLLRSPGMRRAMEGQGGGAARGPS